MDILLFTPLHPDYGIRPEALQSIMDLKWGGGRLSICFEKEEKPTRGGYENILHKYQRGRSMALGGGYDALVTIEADMIVPAMTLERLARAEADVAYGLYCSRSSGKHVWLAALKLDLFHFETFKTPEECKPVWGSVIYTDGVGFGCTLIHRHVLEALSFRLDRGGPANDWFFSLDCKEHGFIQAHDLGVICGHMLDERRVVWPDPNLLGLHRIEDVAWRNIEH